MKKNEQFHKTHRRTHFQVSSTKIAKTDINRNHCMRLSAALLHDTYNTHYVHPKYLLKKKKHNNFM